MPELLVDNEGPYLGGTRINLADAQGAEKLAKLVKELPINGAPVTLIVEKKAKTPYVAAVVAALGEAGAPKITIKTDGRDDLPKEITVTPEVRISTLPACTVTTMVLKDLSTAIWPVKGGTDASNRGAAAATCASWDAAAASGSSASTRSRSAICSRVGYDSSATRR